MFILRWACITRGDHWCGGVYTHIQRYISTPSNILFHKAGRKIHNKNELCVNLLKRHQALHNYPFGVFMLPLEMIHYKRPGFWVVFFRGTWAGYQYIHSDEYKKIPAFYAYK